jgi:hypothetical protein
MTEPSGYFKQIVDGHNKGWVMGASFSPKPEEAGSGGGKCGEDLLSNGLVGGHVRSAFCDRDLHSRIPLNPTSSEQACAQWPVSRVSIAAYCSHFL